MDASVPRLRPMDMGGLFDATFALYRQNFALFAGICAVLGVPRAILGGITAAIQPGHLTSTTGGTSTFNSGSLGAYFAVTGVDVLLSVIFSALVTGALARAIAARYLGRPITVVQAYREVGVRTYLILLFGSLLVGLGEGFGLLLFIVPGVLLFARWAFFAQVAAIERLGIFASMGRSWNLVRGSTWRVLGISIVLYFMVAVISGIAGGAAALLALGGVGGRIGSVVLSAVVGIFIQPVQLGCLTLLYYDLRVRKEGYDLEHMAQSLESRFGL